MAEVVKPSWIKHGGTGSCRSHFVLTSVDDRGNRQCIFTVDIDAEGKRLATGGMDGTVRVWRLSSVFEAVPAVGAEVEPGRLLASMTRHGGSVLCIRWASQAGILASSSDDCSILVWQLELSGGFRGNIEALADSGPVEENYKVVKRLIGHQSDTVGVEWSPTELILASCGLDGMICLWDASPQSAKTLLVKLEHAHGGFVKGLAWDPTGQLLASQSDDGVCNVWNVQALLAMHRTSSTATTLVINCRDEHECEPFKVSSLQEVFHHASKMTFFHRPSWSPDGTVLALSNASNRHIPVVALVERANWKGAGMSFVGHSSPVEVVKFNPKCLSLQPINSAGAAPSSPRQHQLICAVADQDGQVSVWASCRTSPLLVIKDAFEHTVMDMSWSADGSILVAASYEGSVIAVRFEAFHVDAETLLVPMADEDQRQVLASISHTDYGVDASAALLQDKNVIMQVKENEAFLQNHVISESKPEVAQMPIAAASTASSVSPAPPVPSSVSITKDGKRRITPQLLSQTVATSQSMASGMSQMALKWRDEDFLVHRRLLDRAATALTSRSNPRVALFVLDEQHKSNLALVLIENATLNLHLQVTNASANERKNLATITMTRGANTVLWRERCRGNVYMMAGCAAFSVFATKSSPPSSQYSLLFLSPAGRRILPQVSVDSQVVCLFAFGHCCLALTCFGTLYIWDISACKLLICDSSLPWCLDATALPARFLNSYLSPALDPKLLRLEIAISLGSELQSTAKYVYSYSLSSWLRHGEQDSATSSIAGQCSALDSSVLEQIKLQTASASAADYQVADLEFRLSTSLVAMQALRDVDALSAFSRTATLYALKLAADGKAAKARELVELLQEAQLDDVVREMIIPIFCKANTSSQWQEFVSLL